MTERMDDTVGEFTRLARLMADMVEGTLGEYGTTPPESFDGVVRFLALRDSLAALGEGCHALSAQVDADLPEEYRR